MLAPYPFFMKPQANGGESFSAECEFKCVFIVSSCSHSSANCSEVLSSQLLCDAFFLYLIRGCFVLTVTRFTVLAAVSRHDVWNIKLDAVQKWEKGTIKRIVHSVAKEWQKHIPRKTCSSSRRTESHTFSPQQYSLCVTLAA